MNQNSSDSSGKSILDAIKRHSHKFSIDLLDAERNAVTGIYRFAVKIEKGRALTVQITKDNTQLAAYEVDAE